MGRNMGRELNPNIKVEPPTPEMPNISPPEKFDLIKLESEQIAQSKIDESAKNNPPEKLESEQMDLADGFNENDITYISNTSKNDDHPDIADIDDIQWPDPLFMPPQIWDAKSIRTSELIHPNPRRLILRHRQNSIW